MEMLMFKFPYILMKIDRFVGLVVALSGVFDSRYFHNFKCGLGLEQSPPSLVRAIG